MAKRLQFPAFLFNPLLRVWNLRLLLLWSALNIYLIFAAIPNYSYPTLTLALTFIAPSIVIFHHLIVLIPWPWSGTVLMDLCLAGIEIASEIVSLVVSLVVILRQPGDATLWGLAFCGTFGILLLLSILAASARVATIAKCDQPLTHQHFSMLGGCRRTYPAYTPFRMFFGRAIARPLVRRRRAHSGRKGNDAFDELLMASHPADLPPVLMAVVMAVFPNPKFPESPSPFSSLLLPQIYIKTFYYGVQRRHSPLGNASIRVSSANPRVPVNVTMVPQRMELEPCERVVLAVQFFGVDCPLRWIDVSKISISMDIEGNSDTQARVRLISSDEDQDFPVDEDLTYDDMSIMLFPGSQLVGEFTWIRLDLMPRSHWGYIISPASTVYIAEVRNLQPQPHPISTSANVATLILHQQHSYTMRVLQETVDSTTFTGISTFGGFWTFLSGTFALLFGAHVLYFMLGRRPLSALGIAHIFQRKALIRQWHEDFPAIHTEGGSPGSKNAGIIAFIRNRLVDLDPDPREFEDELDIEAQRKDSTEEDKPSEIIQTNRNPIEACSSFSTSGEVGYLFDEIPLLDVDLGSSGTFDNFP
ncbi:hypothetical protein R3P38DRAFT_3357504 [Favolaschia claudopus]|uniref:Transmembrane protein n=1 Tax=Favolaschia claudopus TaxID=2862362 RepID=A0AAW0B9G2_9AGAR